MRASRCATIVRRCAGVRFAASAPSPATPSQQQLQAAATVGIPKASIGAASQSYLNWQQLSLNGAETQKMANTCTPTMNFSKNRADNVQLKGTTKPITGTLQSALKKAKSIDEVAEIIEGSLLPIRKLEKERYDLQLFIWGRNDFINLGLSVSTKEQVEVYKVEKAKAEEKLAANRKALLDYSKKTFDTATFNAVINVFRVAGATNPNAKAYAEFLLDDMTLAAVPFDEVTKLLLKAVVMGDAPHEDSNMLFTFVENPERGEVSLAPIQNGDLTGVADEAIFTIGRRHTTPVTDHKKLQQPDTHPMLQRSPE